MATPKEIQDKADAAVDPLIADIIAKQDEYIKGKERYWQGIKTPTITPKDGADVVPDKDVKPQGQAESWADFKVAMPATLPGSIEVHTHDGPQGKGFTVYATVGVGKQTFKKAVGRGAHSNTFNWLEIIPEFK
jgi:hypothetical protein